MWRQVSLAYIFDLLILCEGEGDISQPACPVGTWGASKNLRWVFISQNKSDKLNIKLGDVHGQ